MRRCVLLLGVLGLVGTLVGSLLGCEEAPLEPTRVTTVAVPPAQCQPSDQDRYVYHPARLHVLQSCIRVSGVVDALRVENDGDLHIQLRLDPQYRFLLQPANSHEQRDLVVEPVCPSLPLQPDALDVCVGDAHPLTALPMQGAHVWMEGRYVLDGEHGDWAELHPLYRWGEAPVATRSGGSDTHAS
jgi:hypothetical protein